MGNKWPGPENVDVFTIDVSATAIEEVRKDSKASLSFSLWTSHARPIGMLYQTTDSQEEFYSARESWYLMPDEAEALGTALIYYAKQLRGEL